MKTHGSFTEIDVFCQVSKESEKNTIRSYTEVTEIGTQDEAREKLQLQKKLKNLSWALFSSMWCSTARKGEKTEGVECLRTENKFSLAWKQYHFKKNILISIRSDFSFLLFEIYQLCIKDNVIPQQAITSAA